MPARRSAQVRFPVMDLLVLFLMDRTVDLDRDAQVRTIEIHYVSRDDVLSPELEARQRRFRSSSQAYFSATVGARRISRASSRRSPPAIGRLIRMSQDYA